MLATARAVVSSRCSPVPYPTFRSKAHMDSPPKTLASCTFPRSSSLSSPIQVEREGNGGDSSSMITLQEWQGWGTASPFPAMVAEIVEELRGLERDMDGQMSFGGLGGKIKGDFKVHEDKKHRAKYQALGDSEKKMQFFSARQIACRLLGSRYYLCQKVCGHYRTTCFISAGLLWKIACVLRSCPSLSVMAYGSGCTCIQRISYDRTIQESCYGKFLVFNLQLCASMELLNMKKSCGMLSSLQGKKRFGAFIPIIMHQHSRFMMHLVKILQRVHNAYRTWYYFLFLVQQDGNFHVDSAQTNEEKPLNFVLLDGTWNNSAAMFRRLKDKANEVWGEELPCISLATGASAMHKLRPQPSWDRTCTAAAAVGLLDELHSLQELSTLGFDKQAEALEDALGALLDALTARRLRMGRSITRRERHNRDIC
ncbi:hypothetical protein RHMOL_Rhmol06G0204900 [Rhododendron molle]|uniref:Uncharacterized protein n=1 Tax=Rhododendron molle TaxID=49168 RepID=A0ACC0NGQ8_RHOML|nr:hypothetical protein RHMOL_Rhmol06G0204900 [Rhododendron molle]